MGAENTEYGADQIQILEGLEAVRKRPGMYIGSTSSRGLHHLVYEIVDNAVDEALAGFCTEIHVDINPDNSITVTDNGRGIPVGINHKAGIPAVEVVFTILHAGGKFGGGGYKVSGGLHGVGASVVNALSEWLEVTIYHEGKEYKQRYERGKTMYPLKVVGDCDPELSGTKVYFLPDKEIFEETVYDYDILKQRLREMAFLTKGLRIVLEDKREGQEREKVFHYEGGIREFVSYLNRSKEALYPEIIYCEGEKDGVSVEVALQHNVHSYMNYLKVPAKVDELCAILQEKQKKMGTFREQYELSFNAPVSYTHLTIMMLSYVAATIRSISAFSSCSKVGLITNWPSIRATRTSEIGRCV